MIDDDDNDPYGLIRDDVHASVKDCNRFFESLKAEVAALKPMPQRPASPEPPPEEPTLSPDARAARTMLALGNMRIGRAPDAFYAEALEYLDRMAVCPHCGSPKALRQGRDVTINVTKNQAGFGEISADEQ